MAVYMLSAGINHVTSPVIPSKHLQLTASTFQVKKIHRCYCQQHLKKVKVVRLYYSVL